MWTHTISLWNTAKYFFAVRKNCHWSTLVALCQRGNSLFKQNVMVSGAALCVWNWVTTATWSDICFSGTFLFLTVIFACAPHLPWRIVQVYLGAYSCVLSRLPSSHYLPANYKKDSLFSHILRFVTITFTSAHCLCFCTWVLEIITLQHNN